MGTQTKTVRLTAFLLSLAMVLSLLGAYAPTITEAAAKPKLAKKAESLVIGGVKKIKVKHKPKGAVISYKSSKSSVASVSKKGKVTGKKAGSAKITVTVKKGKAKTKLIYKATVKKPALKTKSLSVAVGKSGTLGISHKPAKAAKAKYTWSSSNTSVATVKKGTVTGRKAGTAIIKVKVFTKKKFSYTLSAKVTVTETPPKTYTVTFNSNGGSPVASQTVVEGQAAAKPGDPIRNGYVFGGWHSDSALKNLYNFSSRVTANITLYAKWSAAPADTCTVAFETNGGSAVASQSVKKGQKAVKPRDPVKEEHTFCGWYSDPDLTKSYDFSSPVMKSLVLYAKWKDHITDLGDIENLADEGVVDVIYSGSGDISMIDGRFTDQTVTSKEDAADVLNRAIPLFNSKEKDYYYDFEASSTDITQQQNSAPGSGQGNSEVFYRFNPRIEDIPVLGSQIIVSAKDNGEVSGLFSSYDDRIQNIDTDPCLSVAEAKDIVYEEMISAYNLQSYMDEGTISKSDLSRIFDLNTILLVYAADKDKEPVLAYEVNVTEISGDMRTADDEELTTDFGMLDQSYYIYADGAEAGEIFQIIDNHHDARAEMTSADLSSQQRTYVGELSGDTYTLNDKGRNIVTYKSNKTTKKQFVFFGDEITKYELPGKMASATAPEDMERVAVSAHANMSAVYDYYKNILNRKSYDDSGKKIVVTYNYHDFDQKSENAFWTGTKKQFVFQSASDEADSIHANSVDVMAHEFTHAVIDYTVGGWLDKGLVYRGETGALNEAYADILGSLVEGKNGSARWLIGEDSQTVRDMSDPSAYNQPEHYDSFDPNYERDNGGVHRYSGIFNFAAYKMMSSNKTKRISKETWAKVFYSSLFRLTSNAKFLDARGAVLASAKKYGFTGEEQEAVKKAFDDVGIREPDAIRIVLTWGSTPEDLDSHLVGPGIGLFADRFHIYFLQRSYYIDNSYESDSKQFAADLNYDVTSSFGPEITTIHKMTPGDYYFYVHDYSNDFSETSTAMAQSGAKVKVYYNDSHKLQHTFTINSDSSGTYWNVFKLTISDNGAISVSEIQSYGTEASYS